MTNSQTLPKLGPDTLVIIGKTGLIVTIAEIVKQNISPRSLIGAIYVGFDGPPIQANDRACLNSIPPIMFDFVKEQFDLSKSAGRVIESKSINELNRLLLKHNLGTVFQQCELIFFRLQYQGFLTINEVTSKKSCYTTTGYILDDGGKGTDSDDEPKEYKVTRVDNSILERFWREVAERTLARLAEKCTRIENGLVKIGPGK